MRPIILSLSLLLGFGPDAGAQLRPAELLASAGRDYATRSVDQELQYLKTHSLGQSPIKRLELRSATDEFLLIQQEYALRITPNNPLLIGAQQRVRRSMIAFTKAQQQNYLKTALEARYKVLVEAHFLAARRPLLDSMLLILADKQRVLETQIASGLEKDVDGYFRAAEDALKIQQEIADIERKSLEVQAEIGQLSGSNATLQLPADWPSPIAPSRPTILPTPELMERAALLDLQKRRERMAILDNRQILDFIQVRYGNRDKEFLDERLSVGFGINLPVIFSGRTKRQTLHVETLEAQRKYHIETEIQREITERKAIQTRLAAEQWDNTRLQYAAFQQRFGQTRLYQAGADNPLTLLRIAESRNRQALHLLELEARYWEVYLEYLSFSGALTQEPLRNFCARNFETFTLD